MDEWRGIDILATLAALASTSKASDNCVKLTAAFDDNKVSVSLKKEGTNHSASTRIRVELCRLFPMNVHIELSPIFSKLFRLSSQERCLKDSDETGLSLYVHVPYCKTLCSFCGCTRVISRDYSMAEPFVDMVLRELDLKLTMHEHAKLALKELHLGGGSPTWLEGKLLLKLMKGILDRFPHSSSSRELSIEIDPRTFTEDHAGALQQVGVTRVSLGVQDFHLPTLRAIKRDQPYSVVETAVKRLAKLGVPYNFDLVYGLPYQSKESIEETFRKVVDLGVSRIALYSYAHIPSSKKAQIGVEKHGLPDVTSKRALYETARKILKNSSYLEIGMDHFALPEDELSVAAKNGSLHRNFMGYTVQRTKLLLGLGPSSLSDSWYAFAQNEKESTKWFESIKSGRLDPIAGHLLTEADQERRKVILDLMCRYQAKIKPELWERISRSTLPSDNLVTWNPGSYDLTVTEEGKPFIRNICAVLDDHIQAPQSAPAFSRAI